jgi:hypothetical protein
VAYEADGSLAGFRELVLQVVRRPREFPDLYRRNELPHHALIRLYRRTEGGSERDLIGQALAELLKTTLPVPLPGNFELIYTLLMALSYCIPIPGKYVLHTLLDSEVLNGRHINGSSLHALALGIRGLYGVDEVVRDYILSRSMDDDDFDVLLVGLRLLATTTEPELAFHHLQRNLVRLTPDSADLLAADLREVIRSAGAGIFLKWYSREDTSLKSKYPDQHRLLQAILRSQVLSWPGSSLEQEDEMRLLAAAYVHAGGALFRSTEIAAVARTCKRVRIEVVQAVLKHIWFESEIHFGVRAWDMSYVHDTPEPALVIGLRNDFASLDLKTDGLAAAIIEKVTPINRLDTKTSMGSEGFYGRVQ